MIILILDDNPDIMALMDAMLDHILGAENIHILKARNGIEGLSLLREVKSSPELIISNLRMPEMDGLTFFRTLQSDAIWSQIPRVMMTANLSVDVKREASDSGVQGFLSKPFSIADVRKSLAEFIF
ncbi:MAG: response regulator [Anaerolineae bacterium]|nr:response regulator [Anaerolineae bacterium]